MDRSKFIGEHVLTYNLKQQLITELIAIKLNPDKHCVEKLSDILIEILMTIE